MMTPLDYARAACDTMMRKFAAADLPPNDQFSYHHGVFLSGMLETWRLTGEAKYFRYIRAWLDHAFDENDRLRLKQHPGTMDDIQAGHLLFPMLDYMQENEPENVPKYLQRIASVWGSVDKIPCTVEGGFWHKSHMPNQMWLDGLYMIGPIMSEYAKRFGRPDLADKVVRHALIMRNKTHDPNTGLLYHAWDGSPAGEKEPWADPVTGRAPEFWGRSIGWVPMALLNDLDFLPEEHPRRKELIHMCTDLLEAVCRYQSDEGRWYQVVDKGHVEGNWLENSCSALFVAALCKAMRKGYLPDSYAEAALRGYEAIIRSLEWQGDDLQIGNVCIGTGVGDYRHYIGRPTSVNDLHGVGGFLLMCTEVQRWMDVKPA